MSINLKDLKYFYNKEKLKGPKRFFLFSLEEIKREVDDLSKKPYNKSLVYYILYPIQLKYSIPH